MYATRFECLTIFDKVPQGLALGKASLLGSSSSPEGWRLWGTGRVTLLLGLATKLWSSRPSHRSVLLGR